MTMADAHVAVKTTFQKLAPSRDVAQKRQEVAFSVQGEDIESSNEGDANGTRSCNGAQRVDHGIESPPERVPGQAVVGLRLRAYQASGNVVVGHRDGRGLDRDRMVAQAIDRRIITTRPRGCRPRPPQPILAAGFSTPRR